MTSIGAGRPLSSVMSCEPAFTKRTALSPVVVERTTRMSLTGDNTSRLSTTSSGLLNVCSRAAGTYLAARTPSRCSSAAHRSR